MDTIRLLNMQRVSTPVATAELHALITVLLRHFISHLRPALSWILNNNGPTGNGSNGKKGFGIRRIINQRSFGFLDRGIVDWQALRLLSLYANQIPFPGFQRITNYSSSLKLSEVGSFLDFLLELASTADRQTSDFILKKCIHLIL